MRDEGFCIYSHAQDPSVPAPSKENQTEKEHAQELASIVIQLEQMRYDNTDDLAAIHAETQKEFGEEETAGESEDDSHN